MSSISEQVAREHLHWPAFGECRCGEAVQDDGCGCNGRDPFIEHIAAATEALTRAQVAAEIRAPKCGASDPCDLRDGECCDYCDGLDRAALIAEGVES